MKNNPVGWFEIYVNDVARAKKFYQTVFNFEFKPLPPTSNLEMWGFPMDTKTSGAGGALVKMEGFEAGRNSVIIYFSTEDCAVEEKKIVAAGGQIEKTKTSIGEFGFMTLGKDTEGNVFGLHSMK